MESGWVVVPQLNKKNQKKKFSKLCREYHEINIIDLLDDDQEIICQETGKYIQETGKYIQDASSPPSLPLPSLSQGSASQRRGEGSRDSSEHEVSLSSVSVLRLTAANSIGKEEFAQHEQHEEFPEQS
jgi:hypothetical protein